MADMVDGVPIHTWIAEHYDIGSVREPAGQRSDYIRCRRCGMGVWAVTKHAHNVHGDDVEVMPSHPAHLAAGKSSDHEGRLVRTG